VAFHLIQPLAHEGTNQTIPVFDFFVDSFMTGIDPFLIASSSLSQPKPFGHFKYSGALAEYPLSASTCSPSSNSCFRPFQKISTSGQLPGA
jgi:hypothetical protein